MDGNSEAQSPPPALCASYIALASATASLVTKSFLHPLDTVKCRLQSSTSHDYRKVWSHYHGRWGPRYMYSGLPIKLAFYVPYQAVYMTSYNMTKHSLSPSNLNIEESRWAFLGRTIASATAAELSSCVVRVPMETIKMRVQSLAVSNTAEALQQMRRHGFLACARLVLPQTILHDIPYSAIQWICYESFSSWTKQVLQKTKISGESDDTSYAAWRYAQCFVRTFLSGGFSGFLASIITLPLDTIRTRVVVATSADASATISAVVRDAYRIGGVKIFFRGGNTRVLWVTANMAVYFPIFESFKITLQNIQNRQEEGYRV